MSTDNIFKFEEEKALSNLEFTESERAAIRATYCAGFTDQQFEVCMTFCRVRALLPGKHVIFSLRTSKEWDEAAHAKVPVTKIIFMTTIDAARLIAQRTNQYNGQAPEQYIYLDADGSPSIVSEIPLPKLPLPTNGATALPREPWAVKTTVYRKDFSQPISSVARFDAYAATYNTNEGPRLNEMWSRRGPEQLSKCSEMLSLRKAFPEELGGVFLDSELKPDQDEVVNQPISPAVAVPLPPVVPKVDQTPAVPTDAPRPNETKMSVETAKVVLENLPQLENVLAVPAIQEQLAKEGKQVNQEAVDQVKKDAAQIIGQNTGQTEPVSQTEKPKRGRKPKPPVQKMDEPVAGQITDEDLASLGTPAPSNEPAEEDRKSAQEFVESVTSFTSEEAATQGLPEPPDPLPSKEQRDDFVKRSRALPEPGVDIAAIGEYTLKIGQKTSSKFLTVGDWTRALTTLEESKKSGTLKQLIEGSKNVPSPF